MDDNFRGRGITITQEKRKPSHVMVDWAHQELLKLSKDIDETIQYIGKKLKQGGKILFCGNGGSAADAQHLAAEFIVRLRPHVNRSPISALSLAQDTSTITACGNDYSFDDIFVRPFKALVKKMIF